ncbi:MAG: acylphosphatase [Bacteroidota bacterium]
MDKNARAEITARGLVQGVGFRYFVFRNAVKLELKGYTQNLSSEEAVLTVVEGERNRIEKLYDLIQKGPEYAEVSDCSIIWSDNKDEFRSFDIRHS